MCAKVIEFYRSTQLLPAKSLILPKLHISKLNTVITADDCCDDDAEPYDR